MLGHSLGKPHASTMGVINNSELNNQFKIRTHHASMDNLSAHQLANRAALAAQDTINEE